MRRPDPADGPAPALEPARSDDLRPLFHLIDEVFAPLLAPHGQWQRLAEWRSFRRYFRPGADRVIRRAGRPRALWAVVSSPRCLYLTHIVLAPELQGCGIGTRLLDGLLREADARRRPVELTVHRVNRARFFYERVGFLPILETDTKIRMRYAPELTQTRMD